MNKLIEYFHAGGFLMWPLLACSLIGVAVILERAVRLRRSVLIVPRVVDDVQALIEQGSLSVAVDRYHESPALVGRVLARGLEEHLATSTDIETSLQEAGERGLQVLNNNLSVLNLISRVAPLLGLLGTVVGMITGFEELAKQGVGKQQLAASIQVALITTAAGLFVAIPTIVAGAYFRSKVRRLSAEFEEIFIDVIKSVKAQAVKRTVT